jgi:hypothetical protein
MNEKAYRIFINEMLLYTRATGPEPIISGRKMRAGAICCSCKAPLPEPHTPGRKRCANCVGKRLVYMSFRRCFGWHCRFTEKGQREPLPRRISLSNSQGIVEIARRGNGLTNDEDRRWLNCAIEVGRGGIWLRLSEEQYLKLLGGVQ